jgi:hypothetical protein
MASTHSLAPPHTHTHTPLITIRRISPQLAEEESEDILDDADILLQRQQQQQQQQQQRQAKHAHAGQAERGCVPGGHGTVQAQEGHADVRHAPTTAAAQGATTLEAGGVVSAGAPRAHGSVPHVAEMQRVVTTAAQAAAEHVESVQRVEGALSMCCHG